MEPRQKRKYIGAGIGALTGFLLIASVIYYCTAIIAFLIYFANIDYGSAGRDAYYRKTGKIPYKTFAPHSSFVTSGHIMARYKRQTVNRINNFGFRGRDYSPERHGGVRIACLGDSMTFGSDMDEESIFPTLLEKDLPEALPGHPKVEVLNLGNGAANPRTELIWYQNVGVPFKPDWIVWQILSNDGMNDQYFYDRYDDGTRMIRRFVPGLYDPLMIWLEGFGGEFNFFYTTAFKHWLHFEQKNSAANLEENLYGPLENARTIFGDGTRVTVMVLSYPNGSKDRVRSIVKDKGYDLLDLSDILHGDNPPADLVLDVKHDHHFSAKGHRLVADEMIKYFKRAFPGTSIF